MVAAAYVKSDDTPIIDERSTALAITMMFPIPWGEAGLSIGSLISEIQASPDFALLVSYVGNIMRNDPEGLMNFSAHPTILSTAANIVRFIANQHGLLATVQKEQAKAENEFGLLTVEDVAGSPNLLITNGRCTPYGMSAYDMTLDAHQRTSYALSKLPIYVNPRGLRWWIIAEDGKANYPLGDGSHVFMLSKTDPWALTAYGPFATLAEYVSLCNGLAEGDYIKVLQADARAKAFIGSSVFIIARALGIASFFDPTEATGFAALALEAGPMAAELITGIVFADEDWLDLGVQQSKTQTVKRIAKIIKKNATVITGWASRQGVKIGARALQQSMENITGVMDALGATEDLIMLIAYVIDTFIGERDLVYYINQSNGYPTIVASVPPVAPTLAGPTSGTAGTAYVFSVESTDPDGDNIRYHVTYGDGTSDQSNFVSTGSGSVFSHSFPAGNYTVYCYCVDDKGASSGLSEPHNISISPVGGFLESFESYQLGAFASVGAWTVDYHEPSRVLISDVGMQVAGRSSLLTTIPL